MGRLVGGFACEVQRSGKFSAHLVMLVMLRGLCTALEHQALYLMVCSVMRLETGVCVKGKILLVLLSPDLLHT